MRLEELVIDGEQIGPSYVMRKPRRRPGKREFLVIMTRSGWIECPLCQFQMSPNKLIDHLRANCQLEPGDWFLNNLEATENRIYEAEQIFKALKERAERVIEGEEWDLADFILAKVRAFDRPTRAGERR